MESTQGGDASLEGKTTPDVVKGKSLKKVGEGELVPMRLPRRRTWCPLFEIGRRREEQSEKEREDLELQK